MQEHVSQSNHSSIFDVQLVVPGQGPLIVIHAWKQTSGDPSGLKQTTT